ncbi:MFS transporter [Haloferula helveola]|uniref:MFS transporter n=1 Tax=Haloferula helveola TaxID=490095 RepID=A0ABN6H477_9BACT|nr:MFS transporter [Haloferula helveola]
MSDSTSADQPIAPNANRLLWAGFVAILAAGVGFGVRGGLFGTWETTFNLNGAQLGAISLGAGFISFCFGIIIGGIVVDKVGYGKLVFTAFLLHVLSAFVTFAAKPEMSSETAYQFLYWGTFLFGLANGTLEAVANPLVATLYPKNRTHYLNILHASWPLGMVFGGVIGWTLGTGDNAWDWKWQLALYLVPTLVYGVMFLGQKYPKSEASAKGLKLGEMFKDVGILGTLIVSALLFFFLRRDFFGGLIGLNELLSNVLSAIVALALLGWVATLTKFAIGHWLIFVLFIAHALVGSVELGTDGWIQNITGTILNPEQGKILFVFTSLVMFGLRFCAHFIESKAGVKPIGLLFICSLLAVAGLNLVSAVDSFGAAFGALLVYAIGKTFFWPTMLAVIGDRFPQTGAVAMSLMGGIGMLSVGLLGGPGLGYARDRFSAGELKETDAALYEQVKSAGPASEFLAFEPVQPIDPKVLNPAKDAYAAKVAVERGNTKEDVIAKAEAITTDQEVIAKSDIMGNRKVLKYDSLIPAAMAVIYLLLMLYFRAIGGYKPLTISPEKAAGGTQGPSEF